MSAGALFKAIRRHGLVALLIAVVVLASGLLGAKLMPHDYQSVTRVKAGRNAQDGAELAKSDVVLLGAFTRMGQPTLAVHEVQPQVRTRVVTNSSIIQIEVRGKNPAQTQQLANAIADELAAQMTSMDPAAPATVIARAHVGGAPLYRGYRVTASLFAQIGLIFGLAYLFVRGRSDAVAADSMPVHAVVGSKQADEA